MLRPFFLIGSTAFWLTMMSLLVQRDYLSLTPSVSAYDVLPLHEASGRDEYRSVYLGDKRIGFTFDVLEIAQQSPELILELRHRTYLNFLFLGREYETLMSSSAKLDGRLELREFDARVASGKFPETRLSGVLKDGVLEIVAETGDGGTFRRSTPVAGPLFFSEVFKFIWTPENLKVAKEGSFRVWSPDIMNFDELRFKVEGREKIMWQGKETEAFRAAVTQSGVENRTWIGPDGVVLKQETPTGLLLQKEEGWQVFEGLREERSAPPDLPNLASIPSNRKIADPAALKRLRAQVKSPDGEKTFDLTRADMSGLESAVLPLPADAGLEPFLLEDASIQSKDPAVAGQAREIIAGEKSALAAARKLMDWVHRSVEPMPSVTVPSANEVLNTRRGDCNEYTVLFAAFCRAAGIPARTAGGFVYRSGRFFYHTWAEIYLGRWVPADPTFNELPADVTHVPVVAGDPAREAAFVSRIGQYQILIMETEDGSGRDGQ